MSIENLGALSPVTDSTYFAGNLNAQDYRVGATALASYVQTKVSFADGKVTMYAVPSATGFSVSIPDSNNSAWLILTPTAGFAAGTIVLPAVGNAIDRQEILVNCTQAVTTLTITGNGATVTGAPTTLAANAFFTLRFDAVSKVWYRVG